jgi:hypothetical protein
MPKLLDALLHEEVLADNIYYYTKSRLSKFIDYQWKHAIAHSPNSTTRF